MHFGILLLIFIIINEISVSNNYTLFDMIFQLDFIKLNNILKTFNRVRFYHKIYIINITLFHHIL